MEKYLADGGCPLADAWNRCVDVFRQMHRIDAQMC